MARDPGVVFTKLYFADISRKFRSGTLRGTREYAMSLAPLLDASTAIQAHNQAFAAMAAFALGRPARRSLLSIYAKSVSGPTLSARRAASPLGGMSPDVAADERRAFRALAEADLSSAKRRPPAVIR